MKPTHQMSAEDRLFELVRAFVAGAIVAMLIAAGAYTGVLTPDLPPPQLFAPGGGL